MTQIRNYRWVISFGKVSSKTNARVSRAHSIDKPHLGKNPLNRYCTQHPWWFIQGTLRQVFPSTCGLHAALYLQRGPMSTDQYDVCGFTRLCYPSFLEPESRSNLKSSSHVGWTKWRPTLHTQHCGISNMDICERFQASIQHRTAVWFFGDWSPDAAWSISVGTPLKGFQLNFMSSKISHVIRPSLFGFVLVTHLSDDCSGLST